MVIGLTSVSIDSLANSSEDHIKETRCLGSDNLQLDLREAFETVCYEMHNFIVGKIFQK